MGGLTAGLLSVSSLLFVLSDLTAAAVFRGKFDAVAAETDEEAEEFDC